jgi:hypothetical protein
MQFWPVRLFSSVSLALQQTVLGRDHWRTQLLYLKFPMLSEYWPLTAPE